MVSPTTNFWVGIHSSTTKNGAGAVQAGIAATVEAIPANFTHDTILFAGPSSPRPSSDSSQFPSTCSSLSLVFACSNMGVKNSLILKSTPNSCVTPRVVFPSFGTGHAERHTCDDGTCRFHFEHQNFEWLCRRCKEVDGRENVVTCTWDEKTAVTDAGRGRGRPENSSLPTAVEGLRGLAGYVWRGELLVCKVHGTVHTSRQNWSVWGGNEDPEKSAVLKRCFHVFASEPEPELPALSVEPEPLLGAAAVVRPRASPFRAVAPASYHS